MEHCAVHSGPIEPAEQAAGRADLQSVYDEFAGPLYWYALALLERAEEAEDVVHEVFAALLRRGGGEAIRRPRAYLFKAVRRGALEVRSRRGPDDRGFAERVSWVETGAESDLAVDLDRALKTLPVEQREVVALKVMEGLTFREIAQALRIRPNTAASRYRLALARLRAELQGGKEDE
jgi:RNA polymerase sigma-70 factor (ECF subfamily)